MCTFRWSGLVNAIGHINSQSLLKVSMGGRQVSPTAERPVHKYRYKNTVYYLKILKAGMKIFVAVLKIQSNRIFMNKLNILIESSHISLCN
jgi:hypothetical protein